MLNELYQPKDLADLAWSRPKLTALASLVDGIVQGLLPPRAVLLYGPTGNGKLSSLRVLLRLVATKLAYEMGHGDGGSAPTTNSGDSHRASTRTVNSSSALSISRQTSTATLPVAAAAKGTKPATLLASLAELSHTLTGSSTSGATEDVPAALASPFSADRQDEHCNMHVLHSCLTSPVEYYHFLRSISARCRGEVSAAGLSLKSGQSSSSRSTSPPGAVFDAYIVKLYGEPANHPLHLYTKLFMKEYEQLLEQAKPALQPHYAAAGGTAGEHSRSFAANLLLRMQHTLVFFIHTAHDTHNDKMDLGTAFPREVLSCSALDLFHCTPITELAMQRRLSAVLDQEAVRRWRAGKLIFRSTKEARATTDKKTQKAKARKRSSAAASLSASSTASNLPTGELLLSPEDVRLIAAASQGDMRQALLQVQWLTLLPSGLNTDEKMRRFILDGRGANHSTEDEAKKKKQEHAILQRTQEILYRLTVRNGALVKRSEADDRVFASSLTNTETEHQPAADLTMKGHTQVEIVESESDDIVSVSSCSSLDTSAPPNSPPRHLNHSETLEKPKRGADRRSMECSVTGGKRSRTVLDLMENSLVGGTTTADRDDSHSSGSRSQPPFFPPAKQSRREGDAIDVGEKRVVTPTVRDEYLGLSHATARLLTQRYDLHDVLGVLNVAPRKLLSYLANNLPPYFLANQMGDYEACAAAGSGADALQAMDGGFSMHAGGQFRRNMLDARTSGHSGSSNRTAGDEAATGMAEQSQLDLMALTVFDRAYRVFHRNVHIPRAFIAQRPPPFQLPAYPRLQTVQGTRERLWRRQQGRVGEDNTAIDVWQTVSGEQLEEEFMERLTRGEGVRRAGEDGTPASWPGTRHFLQSLATSAMPSSSSSVFRRQHAAGREAPSSTARMTPPILPPLPGSDMDILREGLPSYLDACGPLSNVQLEYAPFAQYIVMCKPLPPAAAPATGSSPFALSATPSTQCTSIPSSQDLLPGDMRVGGASSNTIAMSPSASSTDFTLSAPSSLSSTQPPPPARVTPSLGSKRTVFKFTSASPAAPASSTSPISSSTPSVPMKRPVTELQAQLLRRGLPSNTALREEVFRIVSSEVAPQIRNVWGGAGTSDAATAEAAGGAIRLLIPDGDTIEDCSD